MMDFDGLKKKLGDQSAAFLMRKLVRYAPLLDDKSCKFISQMVGSALYSYFPIRVKDVREQMEKSDLNIDRKRV